MFTNDELKERMLKVHPDYLEFTGKGNYKWKTSRIFTTILYPENIPNVVGSCIKFGVPCSLSPLHDSDKKDDSEELKKAHYHLVCYYSGKTTPYSFYTALCGAFGEKAFSTFEIGRDLGCCIKYHCHLNDSDKFQYDVNDIKDFNGFDSSKYLISGSGDIVGNFSTLMDLINEKNIIFYNDLLVYLRENDTLLFNTLIMDSKLDSKIHRYMRSREHQMVYDGNIEISKTRILEPNGEIRYLTEKRIV